MDSGVPRQAVRKIHRPDAKSRKCVAKELCVQEKIRASFGCPGPTVKILRLLLGRCVCEWQTRQEALVGRSQYRFQRCR